MAEHAGQEPFRTLLRLTFTMFLDKFLSIVNSQLDRKKLQFIGFGLTDNYQCKYNVITMKAAIISIGNSKGVRIPKPLLEESGLIDDVEIKLVKDGLKITPVKKKQPKINDTLLMSQQTLAKEWDTPEEDEAWAFLQ